MDKNIIKNHLTKRFISEETTPGISVTNKANKESGKINKDGVKAIEKELGDYDKKLNKSEKKTSNISSNKFNYDDNFEKKYHDEMEILNGQEMLQYDSKPKPEFEKRAKEAIEGSSRMGNEGKIGNAEETWGASSDEFGKNLVKRIKASTKKRSEQTPTLNLRGTNIQADIKDTGHRPYAIEEGKKINEGLSERNVAVITKWINTLGASGAAEKIINSVSQTGMVSDLPDSNEYGSAINKISSLLNSNKLEDAYTYAKKAVVKLEKKAMRDMFENKNNNKKQIKESMKRLRFKTEFNGLGNALKLIPESYKTDKKEFEMTDGNENYRIRWEGSLSEGRAVVLKASDKKLVNEDIKRMKELFGYKPQDTLGTLKGNARLDENKAFTDSLKKSRILLGESEEIEGTDAEKEAPFEEAGVKQAPDAKKHIEGSTSTDKGTTAPKPKQGDIDKAVTSAPEAKKYIEGSVSTEKGTKAPAPKNGEWDKNVGGQAADAKKHIHLKETETEEEDMLDEVNGILPSASSDTTTDKDVKSGAKNIKVGTISEEEGDEDGEEEEKPDAWEKPEEDSSMADKEPEASDISKEMPMDIDGDSDEEEPISVPTPPKKGLKKPKNAVKLLVSPSSGEYWIDDNGRKFPVPSQFLSIASDETKKGSEKASIIINKMQSEPELSQEPEEVEIAETGNKPTSPISKLKIGQK